MNLDTFIFLFSAVVAVFGATMMISQRNPVASVLYLILSLVAQAVLYIQLGALFMGAILIIVYAGAILVLFLFVIMLLNLRGDEDLTDHSPPVSRISKYVLSALFLIEMVMIVKSGYSVDLYMKARDVGMMTEQSTGFGSVEDVATVLFQRYLYPFELTSVLLLVAIVGAVIMARRERNGELPGETEKEDDTDNVDFNEVVK